MASEEPLFDPSLKKRKKKTVAFHEDPLGADADPTTPAPATIDDTTTNGVTVDMGTKTLHEQMKESGLDGVAEPAEEKKEDDDFKAMFGDIKKKKKKKDIPLDLGEEGSGTSTPTATAPAAGEDLDFSDLKKKKKTSKKKAAIDMEAFEKELNESKAKEAEEEEAPDGKHLEELDETELGEDPFARGEGAVSVEAGGEPWLGSDRDYTYLEVSSKILAFRATPSNWYLQLLHRFYTQLHAANPALLTSTGKRYTIAPPSVMREGNKKSIFANVSDICKRMHRPPEHVIQYMFAEMGTTGSVDGSGRLVIKGRFQQKQIEHVLRRYIGKHFGLPLYYHSTNGTV
ncbi:unnamed protein product [Somion occarium]|uniref:Translation initiation factor IF2/IF5 domain-containing protein n=1 Tax=Somion occarium TaxID=3059160 RepID=A0ABP1DTR0_9APHY